MSFQDFLLAGIAGPPPTTQDVLASFLPLVRETIETHRLGLVAPLEGLADLRVEGTRIWFEEARRRPLRGNRTGLARVEQSNRVALEVLAETRHTNDVGEMGESTARAEIGSRDAEVARPVYLPGYVAWEHALEHHDPLTDIFSLGLILASLACGLNLNEPDDLEQFVQNRRNLFALRAELHPVVAQVILRMTELDRQRRAQDLPALLHSLENYRDQTVDFDIDLAALAGTAARDQATRTQAVLGRLRDRLFDISRRNNLLHFRPTLGSLNLTEASIPLTLDIRNLSADQILIYGDDLRRELAEGRPLSLNKRLNFAEALYLPSLLERIVADARRDQQELGFAQLRLVLCFLSWANLKVKPAETCTSPLVLLPVKLTKTKGIRDTWHLEAVSSEAEINPVLRHQFRQLYGIELPETVDLAETGLDPLFDFLEARIRASEPAVTLGRIDRPRVDLIHEKARRRLDRYRRNARLSGRGIRHFLNLDYSYDPANYHPLGIKLFSAKVRTPGSRLRETIERTPRPRAYAAPPAEPDFAEQERSFIHFRDASEANPYLWNLDLCSLTLANFRYRRMSLVRDYEAILAEPKANPAFDATFSLSPRPVRRDLPATPPLEDRYDVLPCDPTQAAAVAEARRGESYIIQGPPGTGKSQTIANLIADYVAQGKRVLFVCEKRAAIDVVFARLRQCGLAPLCCLIHDSQTDKKEFVLDLKQTYETFLAEPAQHAAAPRRQDLLQELRGQLSPLEQHDQVMAAEDACAGLPARQLLDRCIHLRELLPPELTPPLAERLPFYADWQPHWERLRELETTIRDLEPSGVLARHPLRLLAAELADVERPIERVTRATTSAKELLDQGAQLLSQSGVPAEQWNSLGKVRQLLDYARRIAPFARHGNLALVSADSDRAKEFAGQLKRAQGAEAHLAAAREATGGWREKFSSGDVQTALEQARRWERSWLAIFSPGWWRLRAALRRAYDFRSHAIRPTWVQVLSSLAREHEAAGACRQTDQQIVAQFSLDRPPLDLDREIAAVRRWLSVLPDWLRRIHRRLVKAPRAEESLARMLRAEAPFAEAHAELSGVLVGFDALPLESLAADLAAIGQSARQIPQALRIHRELAALPAGIGVMLREMDWTLERAEAAVAHRTWDDLCQRERAAGRFTGRDRQHHVERLESLYDGWLAVNAAEICLRVRDRFRTNVQRAVSTSPSRPEDAQFGRAYSRGRRTLEHEFGKSMRYKAIRELVDGEPGLVVRDLKPVWLMSPLSVSDTLPLAADFVDAVIFDEASQVPLEEAVPSLFRGRQVIVVGDEMQLPPTDFFSARQPEEEEFVVEEAEERVRVDLGSDSFLNHAAKNLSATMLGWHYRSKSEALISFSNWAFYDGRLLTVPDEHLPVQSANVADVGAPSACDLLLSRPLSFHLQSGVYDKRRNRSEAEYIAQVVRDLLQRRQGHSIGIIAFSEAQQDEIEAALERLGEEDEAFRQLYDEELEREEDGQFIGLLVKNLENIQGDERDVIILSICYGPGPNGRMLMNFGPINQTGGEKRLNVAFSRARRHMAVVSSIRHAAITNDYNAGANCLKNYLRYAEASSQGDIDSARRVLAGISRWQADGAQAASDDPVCRQLGGELRRRGYLVDEAVGQSHFRVDLAVRRPGDAAYLLGILVDSPARYEQSEPLEADMMRPRLLRAFGWHIATILAKDWYEDPAAELNRIMALLE